MSNIERASLKTLFFPKSIAVIGATEKEGSVGRTVVKNLCASPFGGTVYPINPKRPTVLGVKAYPSVKDVPEPVELAVVCTPAKTVPAIIQELVDCKVPSAIIISAGFAEMGEEGHKLIEEYDSIAKKSPIRILGPNCLGALSPVSGLNASFATEQAKKGVVGCISQSGALCTAILDWAGEHDVGFSHFISCGSMVDIKWGDLLNFFGQDPYTECVVIYMESIGNAREFLSAARAVSLSKPVIVIKAGRTAAAAKAAASHTGTLAGSDSVTDAALARAGVLRVDTIEDIFMMAEILSKQPRPRGKRLCIVTNAGGPGVLSTDALVSGDGELADISPEIFKQLSDFLPEAWSRNNPVDILGDARPEVYGKTLEITAADPNNDGVLVILTPQDMTDPTATAQEVIKASAKCREMGKPLLCAWMGDKAVVKGRQLLQAARIPTFMFPDTACRMFNFLWRYAQNLKDLYVKPTTTKFDANKEIEIRRQATEIIEKTMKEGRYLMTENESKQLLNLYGVPTVQTRLANSREEAMAAADIVGFPCVVKLNSETITHKSDIGGVILHNKTKEDVGKAYDSIKNAVYTKAKESDFQGVTVQTQVNVAAGYELIIGSTTDSQFGPVVVFGSGGTLVEVYKDTALTLPPLNEHLARSFIDKVKISKALKGTRGRPPCNIEAVVEVLINFGRLVVEQPLIESIDINPLLSDEKQCIALDARVLLHHDVKKIPASALRPYPIEYVSMHNVNNTDVVIRPLRFEDESAITAFFATISGDIVSSAEHERALSGLKQHMSPQSRDVLDLKSRMMFFGYYDQEVTLVVENVKTHEILGVGRVQRTMINRQNAEFSLVVGERDKKLGQIILAELINIAKRENVRNLTGIIAKNNERMIHICEKLGFTMVKTEGDQRIDVVASMKF